MKGNGKPGLPKFPLGRVVITSAALVAVLERGPAGLLTAIECLKRHHFGDWGDVSAEDKTANDLALNNEGRLHSAYHIDPELDLWIITEWDRSVTTLLLPSDY